MLRVSEDRALREIFGAKRGEVTGEWRQPRNDLYCSPNIMIKSRIVRWEGYVAGMGRREIHTWVWWET